jgi:hypothetical protein
MLLAYDYPLLDIFVTILAFVFLVVWMFMLVLFIADLFRDPEPSGPAKAAWLLFLLALPYIGTVAYIVVRGRGLGERELERAQRRNVAARRWFGGPSGMAVA